MNKFIETVLIKLGYYSKPDFIIVGAQKAGTSGLFQILNQHSLIIGSKKKEIHYFDKDAWFQENDLTSYHSFFPLPHQVPKNAKLFEATPVYLFHPEVAKRLYNYNPKLKLIVLLRNPASRAFSAWTMYHHLFKTGEHKKHHDPRTFTEAVGEEITSLENTSFFDNRAAYVKRGIYHSQIAEYLKYFPMGQLLFIESNDLRREEEKCLAQIQSFVGVPHEKLSFVEANMSTVSEVEHYKDDLLKLKEFYKPYNKKLYDLIGRNFNWDN
jgi:hypothetical protein